MLSRIYLVIFLSLLFPYLKGQNITIRGKAHESHIGKVIRVYTYDDFVTKQLRQENTDTINKDGFFELNFYSKITQPAIVYIDNYYGKMHVRPDYVYGILFPEISEEFKQYKTSEYPVSLGFIGRDTTELNMLVLDYDSIYNARFLPKNNEFLTHNKLFAKADSLKVFCDNRYEKIKDDYFINYYNYSIAALNVNLSRGEKFLIKNFLYDKPILYKNFEYMSFFHTCFNNYLQNLASSHKGTTLYHIINKKMSLSDLNDFCISDPLLKNDSLRELVIISNLWQFYFNPEFSQEGVVTILSKINTDTKNESHKIITDHMLKKIYNLHSGVAAPMFMAKNKLGTVENMSKLKGKWIYLNFFSTKNNESMREMAKLASLVKTYGSKLLFISICVDNTYEEYINYLKENPKYQWAIWYDNVEGLKQSGEDLYNIINGEGYFLIDNFGTLSLSPADAPSKGIQYRFDAIFKPTRKTRVIGIR
ncbi:MAG: TlpA family protein disulfide reductase [Bacteroidia bacterium]